MADCDYWVLLDYRLMIFGGSLWISWMLVVFPFELVFPCFSSRLTVYMGVGREYICSWIYGLGLCPLLMGILIWGIINR